MRSIAEDYVSSLDITDNWKDLICVRPIIRSFRDESIDFVDTDKASSIVIDRFKNWLHICSVDICKSPSIVLPFSR